MIASEYMGAADRRLTMAFRLAVIAAVPLMYVGTLESIVQIWQSSEAYVHGFLIPLISVALIWQKRKLLSACEPDFSLVGLGWLIALALLWSASDFAGVQLTRQIAAVAMIPAAVLCVFGSQVFRTIRFALLYLLLAVPFGDFLIPHLIDFTARFTVDALHVVGVPVFRDGRYFLTPSGAYEVAKACSGLKYIVTTFALTTLFSYFLFAGIKKRLVFVGFALLLSVFANGLRATTVVLLLHHTDLDIAAGEDHEFVGWIFYTLVVFVLIWVGNRYQDRDGAEPGVGAARQPDTRSAGPVRSLTIGALAVGAASLGPLLAIWSASADVREVSGRVDLPSELDGWRLVEPESTEWRPRYRGYTDTTLKRYVDPGGAAVDVSVVRYTSNRQGAEITNATNAVVDVGIWTLGNVWHRNVDVGNGEALSVKEVQGVRPGESRLIWYWTEVNGTPVDGPFRTKLAELRQIVSGGESMAAVVVVSSPLRRSERETELLLSRFMKAFYRHAQSCISSGDDAGACSDGMTLREED